jgi:hypothetical protein
VISQQGYVITIMIFSSLIESMSIVFPGINKSRMVVVVFAVGSCTCVLWKSDHIFTGEGYKSSVFGTKSLDMSTSHSLYEG